MRYSVLCGLLFALIVGTVRSEETTTDGSVPSDTTSVIDESSTDGSLPSDTTSVIDETSTDAITDGIDTTDATIPTEPGPNEEAYIVHSASCLQLEPGFDVATDQDIGTEVGVSEPSHCCAACEKTSGCRAWAWNYIGPTCYLKNTTKIMPAKDSTTRAGVMGDLATCSVHKGFDIAPGEDLSWHLAQAPADCCGICAAIPECNAWSYNVSPPRCYLKSGTTLVPAFDITTIAGIVRDRHDSRENLVSVPGPASN